MQLKIASITNLTDARFFSAVGAHYLGFCFDVLNEKNISITHAKEIINWLHQPVLVGEFGHHQPTEEIEFIAKEMKLNEIQIPFSHPHKAELPFEKFLVLDENQFTLHSTDFTDYLVLKINKDYINNKLLIDFIAKNKVFIEADFTKETIKSIIEKLNPYGIQFSCKKETKTGFSNVEEYAELLDIIGFS